MVDKNDLSVDEILAMCRQIDGGGSAAPAEPAGESPAPEAIADAEPVASKPAESVDPSSMSVVDILSAARGGAAESEAPAAQES